MALVKKLNKDGLHSEVTFKVSAKNAPKGSNIFVTGDFNQWQMADVNYQLEKKGNSYTKTIKLKNGKKYEFRYLNLDFVWFNDEKADAYVASPFNGIDNSVVDLSKVKAVKKAVKKPVKKAVSKSAVKTVKKTAPDDLKKIEGIGPKIASILAENGVSTFKKLSETKVTFLTKVLKDAGPRYGMHKPNTWPKQAKLADQGKWDDLKKLQDKLDGGK